MGGWSCDFRPVGLIQYVLNENWDLSLSDDLYDLDVSQPSAQGGKVGENTNFIIFPFSKKSHLMNFHPLYPL